MTSTIRIADYFQQGLLDRQVELQVFRQLRQEEMQDMPRVSFRDRVFKCKQKLEYLLVLIVDRVDPDREAVIPLHRLFLLAVGKRLRRDSFRQRGL
jgi:hypothetical protein